MCARINGPSPPFEGERRERAHAHTAASASHAHTSIVASASRADAGIVPTLEVWSAVKAERLALRHLVTGEVGGPTIEWTYRELYARALGIANELAELTRPGARSLLLFPPGLDFIAAFFGCLVAGVIAVPAAPPDPRRPTQSLRRLLAIARDSGASLVLTVQEIERASLDMRRQAPDLAALPWLPVERLPHATSDDARATTPEDVAFLQYTSGATGEPRGVMVTHANLMANAAAISEAFQLGEHDTCVGWLPLFHDMGLIGNVLQTVVIGGTMTLMSPQAFLKQPLRWLRAVSHYAATISGGPDFAYHLCAHKVTAEDVARLDLSRWRIAFTGAEPVRAATLSHFARAFAPSGFALGAWYPCYGLAEATLLASGREPRGTAIIERFAPEALREGVASTRTVGSGVALVSCGRPMRGASVCIVDPARQVALPDDRLGEVWLRGPHVAAGYWGREAESRATFAGRLAGDEEAWLRTGDLGFVHAGELYLRGRMKDLIIVNGLNHHAVDIEHTAESVVASVRAGCSAAFSVERDGRELVVLVAEVAEADGELAQLDSVPAILRAAIAERHQLRIDDVLLLRARTIPRTSSGKIKRHACREGYIEGRLEVVVALDRSPSSDAPVEDILAFLLERIRGEGGIEAHRVGPHSLLSDLGLASLESARLAGELERFLGFEVPPEIFYGQSVVGVASLLADARADATRAESHHPLQTNGGPDAPQATVVTTPRSAPATAVSTCDCYATADPRLARLYEQGKRKQWDADRRIDWSLDLDPENPQELPDANLPIHGSPLFERMTRGERATLRRHFQAWQLAQFMHGEQGGLLGAARIVQLAPTLDLKAFAATQVMDEARHLEAFSRLLRDKFELAYPVEPAFGTLLADVVGDARWDVTVLGIQVLIEGLALAAFSLIRDQSTNPLARSVHAYVMEDEARHVAFGRLALAAYYPTLSDAERDEREELVIDACHVLRDRFQAADVWARLGLPVEACLGHMRESGFLATYRAELFSRIVPTIRAIGLWGPRVRGAFAAMGVLGFADVDYEALAADDQRVAADIDARPRARGEG